MKLDAIETVLTAIYNLTEGNLGVKVGTTDIVNECCTVMPMNEMQVVDLLGDLIA